MNLAEAEAPLQSYHSIADFYAFVNPFFRGCENFAGGAEKEEGRTTR